MKKVNFKISGMSCASCAASIEKEVLNIPGVTNSSVNYAVESGSFSISSDNIENEIRNKILHLGYKIVKEDDQNINKTEDVFNKFLISITLSLFLFSLAMWPLMGWPSREVNWYLQMVLSLPIWLWIGKKFLISLLTFFKTGRSNMNTLIGLGTTAAFLYSSFVTIFPTYAQSVGLTMKVYFEAVGFIISFVYLGNFFEEKAKRKTTEALNSLFKLSSKSALRITNGEAIEVSLEEVVRGDTLRVKPGEKIPVDGKILKGRSAINESMITGEPMPLMKSIDDKVFAGTINGDSVIDFVATKVGNDTFLSQIITFVEQAQNSKPEIQKFADRVSSIFTPIVIVISIVTLLIWLFFGPAPVWGNSISNFIAVLVIACPCALGLATPTAVVVATGRASLKGLLIGGGEVIEKATNIDTIIFDKTGTITEGRPTVVDSVFYDDSILLEVASIEQFSEHPLSKAIVNFSVEKNFKLQEPDSFETIKGKGLRAQINDHDYIIGNRLLLEETNISLNDKYQLDTIGSLVFISKNNCHVGTMVIGDKVKEGSKLAISSFRKRNIETWMITGDNEIVAKSVADELGIDHFIANALPIEKADKVIQLQEEGKIVAMVGDGVNDAPALAKANLSLAMGTGTDVAINASDVTIVKGDLIKAIEFIDLSIGTMKIIKQNLFLSMIYNSLLIPVAAGVLVIFDGPMMPPVLASVAMALSSICVVTNSLRIKNII